MGTVVCGSSLGDSELTCGAALFNDPQSGGLSLASQGTRSETIGGGVEKFSGTAEDNDGPAIAMAAARVPISIWRGVLMPPPSLRRQHPRWAAFLHTLPPWI